MNDTLTPEQRELLAHHFRYLAAKAGDDAHPQWLIGNLQGTIESIRWMERSSLHSNTGEGDRTKLAKSQ